MHTNIPPLPTDDFQNKSDTFMHWLSSLPGFTMHPSLTLTDLRPLGRGRGVVATEPIDAETALFTIPRSAILTPSTSSLSSLLPAGTLEDMEPWPALILTLIFEFASGDMSPWKDYLALFPRVGEWDTLMFWSEGEVAELQASGVVGKIGREGAEGMFRESVIPVVLAHRDVVFPLRQERRVEEGELVDMCHCMASIIMAYAFDLDPPDDESAEREIDDEGYALELDDDALPKGLVPLADMLNADASGYNARLYHGTEALTMRSLCRIEAGEEILNDYGALPRADLLRRYGYIAESYRACDVVEVGREMFVEAAGKIMVLGEREVEKRLSYLDTLDLLEDGYDIPLLPSPPTSQTTTPPSPFPLPLLTLLSTLLLPPGDKTYKHLPSMMTTTPLQLTHPLTIPTHRLLHDVLRQRLLMYPTSIAQDMEMLRDVEGVTGRRRMAIEVRLGEKVCLSRGMDAAMAVVRAAEGLAVGDGMGSSPREEGPRGKRRRVM